MSRAWLVAAGGLALIGTSLAAAQRSRGPEKARFTASQAVEGARIYAVRCAVCHGATLDGSVEIPGLKGKFMANWAGKPVGDLYDYVARAMPQSAPGSLSEADNVRLVAFLLRENGLAAGSAPFPVDRPTLGRLMLMPVPPR